MFHFLDSICALVVEDKPLEKMMVMIIKSLSLKLLGCMIAKAMGPFPPIVQVNKRYSDMPHSLPWSVFQSLSKETLMTEVYRF